MSFDEMDIKVVNVIWVFSIDMIEYVEFGYFGMLFDVVLMVYVMYKKYLWIDFKYLNWLNCDWFVLFVGYSLLMLYVMLYLVGYGIIVDDLKNFRCFDSLILGYLELIIFGVDVVIGLFG